MSKNESEQLESLVKDYMKTDRAKPPILEVLKALCKTVTIGERLSIIKLPRKHFIGAHSRKDGNSNEDINCLHLAAKQGDTDMISVMIDGLPEDVKVKLLTLNAKVDGHIHNVVIVTSRIGNVEWLIREVNLFGSENNKSKILTKSLCYASFKGELAAVRAIIEQLHSDTRVVTLLSTPSTLDTDQIATHCAAECGDATVMTAILAGLSRDDATELLLARNNKNGQTALHYAIKKNNPSMVKVILEGCSSEDLFDLLVEKDNRGNTAVHCAAINRNRVLIKALSMEKLSSGQQMEVFKMLNKENQTVLDLARQSGNSRTVRYFEELNNKSSDPRTLHDNLTEQIKELTIQRDRIAQELRAQQPLKLPYDNQDKLGAGVLTNEYKRIEDVKMPEKNTFKSKENQWNIIGPESSSGGFSGKLGSLDAESNFQNNLGDDDMAAFVESDTKTGNNDIHLNHDPVSDGAVGGQEDSEKGHLVIDPLRGPEFFPDQQHDDGEPASSTATGEVSNISPTTKSKIHSAKDDAPSGI